MRAVPFALLIIVLALVMPSHAWSATYAWNPETATLTVDASTTDHAVKVYSAGTPDVAHICGDENDDDCATWTGVRHLIISLTDAQQDVGIYDSALRYPGGRMDIQINGVNQNRFKWWCSTPNELAWSHASPTPCSVISNGSTLDLNADHVADVTFSGSALDRLELYTGPQNDHIDLRSFSFPIRPKRVKDDYQIFIEANSGNDRVQTGKTRDSVELDAGDDRVDLGAGDDGADGGSGKNVIIGGAGDDVLGANFTTMTTMYGGPGNDFMQVKNGNTRMYGGPGNDSMSHGNGTAWFDMGPGNDQGEHLHGPFTGYGGTGNDSFRICTCGTAGLTAKLDCGPGIDHLPVPYPNRKNCEKILFPNRPTSHGK